MCVYIGTFVYVCVCMCTYLYVCLRMCTCIYICVVVTRHGERTTTSRNRTQLCWAKAKKACLIQNQTKSHTLNNAATKNPGRNQRSYPPWVESRHPQGPVSPYRCSRAGRSPNEWRSRLFKPCFSTCSSGALHVLNWPGQSCHNIYIERTGNLHFTT